MLKIYDRVSSTIDIAKTCFYTDIDILAIEQSHGVGKQGRAWHSPIGNLFLSMNMKNYSTLQITQSDLAIYFGVMTGLTIQTFKMLSLKYKFPNDIYLGGKKLAGLLIDAYDDRMIVSIGCNLRRAPVEFANLHDYKMVITPIEFYIVLKHLMQKYPISIEVLKYTKDIWMQNLL